MAHKILLVDDDEDFLTATKSLLENEGYEVAVACSAGEARSQLGSCPPDLILLDVIMPAQDGFVFADELAKDKVLARIPIVLLTSIAENAGQMMRAFGEDKGLTAVDVLPKSAISERLFDAVASALGRE